MALDQLINDLQKQKNPEKAKALMRFFKTGKGEYGEGDRFLGIMVPIQRMLAKKYYKEITLPQLANLLKSPVHEYRLTALIIATLKTKKADDKTRKAVYDFYLKNTRYINNWDLVDVTCRDVVGGYLIDNDRSILYQLARSKDLWEKRIAIISTFAFLKKRDIEDSLKICQILLHDDHDLIHKAVGWTLREVGKIDVKAERAFLDKHYKTMPRTALRYAIEKFPKKLRDSYLGRLPLQE